MKTNYEATARHINKHFDRITEIVNMLIYCAHLIILGYYRINWNGSSAAEFWSTVATVVVIAIVGIVLASAVNWYVKYRLLKALSEEEKYYNSIRKVA